MQNARPGGHSMTVPKKREDATCDYNIGNIASRLFRETTYPVALINNIV